MVKALSGHPYHAFSKVSNCLAANKLRTHRLRLSDGEVELRVVRGANQIRERLSPHVPPTERRRHHANATHSPHRGALGRQRPARVAELERTSSRCSGPGQAA